MKCKICNREYKSLAAFSEHVGKKHNFTLIEYYTIYENFKVPKCEICDNNAKQRRGLNFNKTCCSIECIKKYKSTTIKFSDETREILRQKRLAYMKANPEKTAWRTKNNMSWPEKFFINACKDAGLLNKFLFIREKSFYPYFADFTIEEEKVVIEIDGSQHLNKDRYESDCKKDNLIASMGYKIYRIPAKLLYSEIDRKIVIEELTKFINSDKIYEKCRNNII